MLCRACSQVRRELCEVYDSLTGARKLKKLRKPYLGPSGQAATAAIGNDTGPDSSPDAGTAAADVDVSPNKPQPHHFTKTADGAATSGGQDWFESAVMSRAIKLRVALPNSRNVYSVPDLISRMLRPNECFVQIMYAGKPRVLQVGTAQGIPLVRARTHARCDML
jgi:hypothetical protein